MVRFTGNARAWQASLRLRTDVSLLASLYSERANRAGAPFSSPFSVSLSLSLGLPGSLFLALLPVQLSAPLSLHFPSPSFARCTYCHVLLLLRCTPFITSTSSSPPSPTESPSSCAFLPYLAPTLPTLLPLQLHVHRFNHEYLFPPHSIRIRPSRFIHSLRLSLVILRPCSARFDPLPSLIVLLLRSSFHRSVSLWPLFLSFSPTRPAFLPPDFCSFQSAILSRPCVPLRSTEFGYLVFLGLPLSLFLYRRSEVVHFFLPLFFSLFLPLFCAAFARILRLRGFSLLPQ